MSDFVSIVLGFEKGSDGVNFEKVDHGAYLGYKVMKVGPDGRSLISGANSSITLPLKAGVEHQMNGAGIFIGNDPEYVVGYYSYKESEEDPDEVVLQYEFKISDVVHNVSQIGDKNPEIGVKKAKVKAFILISAWAKGKRF